MRHFQFIVANTYNIYIQELITITAITPMKYQPFLTEEDSP